MSASPALQHPLPLALALRAGGGGAIVLGLAVLAEWYSGFFPFSTATALPAAPATGLAVACCGLGLLALGWGERRLMAICGALTILVAVVPTVAWPSGGVLARLPLLPPAWPGLPHPRQTAPNAALALALCGLVLLGAPSALNRSWRIPASILGLAVAAALSLAALIGYLSGLEGLYQWGFWRPMAPEAAVAILLLSTGLLLAVGGTDGSLLAWLPLPVGTAGAVLTLVIARALHATSIHATRQLPAVTIVVGLLGTAVAALALLLLQRARRAHARAEGLRRELVQEMVVREAAEEALRRANRLYRTLSVSNRIIASPNDEYGMLRQICDALVKLGGYQLAWVGLADDGPGQTVRVAAVAGEGTNLVAGQRLASVSAPLGGEPTGRAISENGLVILHEPATGPGDGPRGQAASACAYVAIPLQTAEGVAGALCLWSRDGEAFDDEEVAQLRQLGTDLSYGLQSRRSEAGRRAAEQARAAKQQLIEQISATSPVGITVVEPGGQITYANPYAEKVLGFSRAAVEGLRYNAPEWQISAVDGGPFPDEALPFARVMRTGLPVEDVRHAIVWPDGRRVILSINGAPLLAPDGALRGVICALSDISSQLVLEQELARANASLEQRVVARTEELEAVNRRLADELEATERLATILAEREHFIQQVADSIPNILCLYDLKHHLPLYSNSALTAILGWTLGELQQMGKAILAQLLEPAQKAILAHHIAQLRASRGGESVEVEVQVRHRDGTPRWLSIRSIVFQRDEAGAPTQILGVARDSSQARVTAEALALSHAQLQQALHAAEQQAAELKLLGELGTLLQRCLSVEDVRAVLARGLPMLLPLSAGIVTLRARDEGDLTVSVPWGKQETSGCDLAGCWALRCGRPVTAGGGSLTPHCHQADPHEGARSLCVPIQGHGETYGAVFLAEAASAGPAGDEWQSHVQQLVMALANQLALTLANLTLRQFLEELATHDPLTGLTNRRALDAALLREVRRARRGERTCGVIMLDIDHFKRVNDTYGHEAGDRVLVALARVLQRGVRDEDVVARFGGEEFVIILPEASLAETTRRAEELRTAVTLLLPSAIEPLPPVTISLGAAVFPDHGASGAEVLHAADAALYEAKAQGRNRAICAQRRDEGDER